MEYTDKNINCKDCGQTFIFTAGEQSFYSEKGFENEPVRCPSCRGMRKRNRNGMGSRGGFRQMHEVTCHDCGKQTQVPFEPRESRPVYCRDCYDRLNAQAV